MQPRALKTLKAAGPNENTVRAVIVKYLEANRKIKIRATKGAGPDFIFDGEIVETKGSRIDFDRAARQMLDYASKYRALSLALPVQALTARRVMQLDTLGKIIQKQHSRLLKLICIVENSQPNTYTVGEHYAGNLAFNVIETIGRLHIWTYPETEGKQKNYEAERIREIDSLVRTAIAQLTRKATRVSTASLQ